MGHLASFGPCLTPGADGIWSRLSIIAAPIKRDQLMCCWGLRCYLSISTTINLGEKQIKRYNGGVQERQKHGEGLSSDKVWCSANFQFSLLFWPVSGKIKNWTNLSSRMLVILLDINVWRADAFIMKTSSEGRQSFAKPNSQTKVFVNTIVFLFHSKLCYNIAYQSI